MVYLGEVVVRQLVNRYLPKLLEYLERGKDRRRGRVKTHARNECGRAPTQS
jgi:hypothetical protein